MIRILIVSGVILIVVAFSVLLKPGTSPEPKNPEDVLTFENSFGNFESLDESDAPNDSANHAWWLNSGARFVVSKSVGRTLIGDLPKPSLWQKRYAQANSEDSDGGLRPQNIFRLITRSCWTDVRAEASFRMLFYDHQSSSQNRNSSNGFTIMSRYTDGQDFYYGGLRLDGSMVIKKKKANVYYEMAFSPVSTKVSLGQLIGLRLDTKTDLNGNVDLNLYLATSTDWQLVLQTTDNRQNFGGAALTGCSSIGLRTDFMDAEISRLKISKL